MLPDTAFNLTAHGRVYTANALPGHLATAAAQDILPRLNDTVVESEQLRTRYLMYLPAHFAHLFLNNKGMPPKDAYLTFLQAAQQENGQQDDIQPILDWLRLTLHATQQNNLGPPVTAMTVSISLLNEDLSAHRFPLVAHILAPHVNKISQRDLSWLLTIWPQQ